MSLSGFDGRDLGKGSRKNSVKNNQKIKRRTGLTIAERMGKDDGGMIDNY